MKSLAIAGISFVLLCTTLNQAADAQGGVASMIRKKAPPGITATFDKCIDRAGLDALASGACLSAERYYQDKRLNHVYKKLLGDIDEKARPALIAAERSWIKLQDEDVALEEDLYGGEQVGNLRISRNEIFRICERANVLERYLELAKDKI